METRRPKFLTPAMASRAAEKLIDIMIGDGLVQSDDREQAIRDVAKVADRYSDGYAIAKALDGRCGWDCDMEIATALDAFGCYARDEIADAEVAWAKANNIKPPFPDGEHIRLPRGETGKITGIYPCGAAKYLVKIDGDPQAEAPHFARRIVNFEDVTPVAAHGGGR